MDDNLPELRDIHLPDGVSIWPPAYGWWVVLGGIILALVCHRLFFYIRSKSKKLYALHLLQNIHCNNSINSVVQMSEILRRICIYKYKEAAVLMGEEWLNFLNSHCQKKLKGKTARLLLEAPYLPPNTKGYTSADVISIREYCREWIGENL